MFTFQIVLPRLEAFSSIPGSVFEGNPLESISISKDASFDLSAYGDAGVEIIIKVLQLTAASTSP